MLQKSDSHNSSDKKKRRRFLSVYVFGLVVGSLLHIGAEFVSSNLFQWDSTLGYKVAAYCDNLRG